MSLNNKITSFIDSLEGNEDNLFPYLHNSRYVKGESNIFYSGPYWDREEIEIAILQLLSGKWLSSGEAVNKFEKEFSKKFDFEYSVMVNSGSSANLVMIAALKKYFKWNDGDEIIVSVCGFPTTINPIIQNNLTPIFVDIDYMDLNWNLKQIVQKITPNTKAIFSSPVLGNPGNYDKLVEICETHKIKLIADNCDSLGSKWKGEFLTKHAIAASCSFYPAHHICTIEGGMVSSSIPEIINIARSFSWWGRGCYCIGAQNLLKDGMCKKRFSKWLDNCNVVVDHKYVFDEIGYNLKPLDIQGAIGLVQLNKFDEIHEKRRNNKERLHKIFNTIPGVRVIEESIYAETSWFGVPIIAPKIKHHLVKYLEDNKVQTRNYFAGNILMHPAYKNLEPASNYPEASKVLNEVFFIGCSPVITDEMIDYIQKIMEIYNERYCSNNGIA